MDMFCYVLSLGNVVQPNDESHVWKKARSVCIEHNI